MREINVDELKKIQIGILDVVDAFCRENNINYWLDCGTLLGAVRHRGYIPWDDDIDIGMLRYDYDKFAKAFNNNISSRYKFLCPELNPEYCYAHGKVIDTATLLYEPDKNGRKLAVNIDIVVYDNAPDNKKEISRMFKKRDFYRKLNVAHSQDHDIIGGLCRNIGFQITRLITKPFNKNYFALKMVENSKRYINAKTDMVGNFLLYSRMVCPKSVFDEYVELEFEGKQYKVPQGYDIWLKKFYKNYMQLPPVEKRISTHVFEAYYKD